MNPAKALRNPLKRFKRFMKLFTFFTFGDDNFSELVKSPAYTRPKNTHTAGLSIFTWHVLHSDSRFGLTWTFALQVFNSQAKASFEDCMCIDKEKSTKPTKTSSNTTQLRNYYHNSSVPLPRTFRARGFCIISILEYSFHKLTDNGTRTTPTCYL